jgi:NAD(P)-dependent dehydrogenase (short-subunit alcohol dehydrogenase family)
MLLKQNNGSIINTASIAGLSPPLWRSSPDEASYVSGSAYTVDGGRTAA